MSVKRACDLAFTGDLGMVCDHAEMARYREMHEDITIDTGRWRDTKEVSVRRNNVPTLQYGAELRPLPIAHRVAMGLDWPGHM